MLHYLHLDRPDIVSEAEVSPTLLQYEDGCHYRNILAPLVKLETDYDRQIKESLCKESISVRWENDDYVVEHIWKSTSFDRMQNALKTFAIDDASVTRHMHKTLLGHLVEEQRIASVRMPTGDEEHGWSMPVLISFE